MTPAQFLPILSSGAAFLTEIASNDRACVLLLAIAQQESGLRSRQQINGPAHGWWQFEEGGTAGVLAHEASGPHLRSVCTRLSVPIDARAIYDAITYNDHLAFALARLLLWTDPAPLPATDDAATGWAYYRRLWRPGRPRRWDWDANYAGALAAVVPPPTPAAEPHPELIAGTTPGEHTA